MVFSLGKHEHEHCKKCGTPIPKGYTAEVSSDLLAWANTENVRESGAGVCQKCYAATMRSAIRDAGYERRKMDDERTIKICRENYLSGFQKKCKWYYRGIGTSSIPVCPLCESEPTLDDKGVCPKCKRKYKTKADNYAEV